MTDGEALTRWATISMSNPRFSYYVIEPVRTRWGELDHAASETGVKDGYTYLRTRNSGKVYASPNPTETNPDLYTISGVGLVTEKEGVTFTASANASPGD
jgi:hypothetical protein